MGGALSGEHGIELKKRINVWGFQWQWYSTTDKY